MTRTAWLPAAVAAMMLGAGSALAQGTAPAPQVESVSTATLASICAATSPDAEAALTAYCRGFFVGAGQYHSAISAAGSRRVFCLPQPGPKVEQVQAAFVQWARANTQYGSELAVHGLMRFAASAYPCPPEPPAEPVRARGRQR